MTPAEATMKIRNLLFQQSAFWDLWQAMGDVTRRIAEGRLSSIGWQVTRKELTPAQAAETALGQLLSWDDWRVAWNNLDVTKRGEIQAEAEAIFAKLVEANP